jgi:uncharacterized protein (UPF0332 family)
MAAQTKHTIELYLKAADEATANAKFNLDGGYPGVAANRAYYAFFYGASALLLSINIIRSKHSAVLSAFRQHFIKPGLFSPDFSDAFGEALDTRQAVDYDMTYGVDEWQAQQLVQTADNFILTVRNYLAKELSDE